jgi:hypothetical protein
MPPEILALIDKPWLLALVLGIGAVCGMLVERFAESLSKAQRRAYWRGRKHAGGGREKVGPLTNFAKSLVEAEQRAYWRGRRAAGGARTKVLPFRNAKKSATDLAADQLRTVMEASFKPRPLLNQPERRLLSVLDRVLSEESPGWRAMGQVSLGEVLWSDDKDAFWAINAKRVDLLIVDCDCKPLHAIEFQGKGHHMSEETAARDAIKKEALRRAGIGYVEVITGDTPAEVREMVRKLVGRVQASHGSE